MNVMWLWEVEGGNIPNNTRLAASTGGCDPIHG
jgi:hypothetical protein